MTARHHVLVALLLGMAGMSATIAGTPWLAGHDSYYHLRMARMLPEIGATRAFPWLHWTIFRDNFVSHHLGFQAVLSPFAWISDVLCGDLVPGGRVLVVLSMALTAVLLFLVLRELRVGQPLLWVALLGCLPWHFWMRLSYARAPVVALPLLLLAVLLFIREKPVALAILACVFMNVYFGAVVFAVLAAALFGGHVLSLRVTRRQFALVVASGLGLAAGLVINPYFPENIEFLYVQIFRSGLAAPPDVGNEWKPLDTWFFAQMCAPLAAVWFAALILRLRNPEPISATSLGLLLLNLAFLVLTLKGRRFIEYWPVFALINAADLAPFRAGQPASNRRIPAPLKALATAIFALLCASGPLMAQRAIRPPADMDAVQGAMAYLRANSPKGSLVLTDDWDLFPICFYYNTHNRYAVGLDPMFTAVPYPELWERYRIITRGKAPARIPMAEETRMARLEDIGTVFEADYVIVMQDHRALYRQLAKADQLFEQVYPRRTDRRPPAAVFRVKKFQGLENPG